MPNREGSLDYDYYPRRHRDENPLDYDYYPRRYRNEIPFDYDYYPQRRQNITDYLSSDSDSYPNKNKSRKKNTARKNTSRKKRSEKIDSIKKNAKKLSLKIMKASPTNFNMLKQLNILANSIKKSRIYLNGKVENKMNADGTLIATLKGKPKASPDKSVNCRLSSFSCGLKLSLINQGQFNELMMKYNTQIDRNYPESVGKMKAYLLLTHVPSIFDNSRYDGNPVFYNNVSSYWLTHIEIIIDKEISVNSNIYAYGVSNEKTYVPTVLGPTMKDYISRDNFTSTFGIICLGNFEISENYRSYRNLASKLFYNLSKQPLPEIFLKNIKPGGKKILNKKLIGSWKNDVHEDNYGNERKFCTINRYKNQTLSDLFIPYNYDFLFFNCQTFIKGFLSVLRCCSIENPQVLDNGVTYYFSPIKDRNKNNLKLDVVQLNKTARNGVQKLINYIQKQMHKNYGKY